jgi:hypothetical protein
MIKSKMINAKILSVRVRNGHSIFDKVKLQQCLGDGV